MTIRLRPCRSLSILVKRSCQFSGATGLGFFWLILAWGLVCDTWSFAVDTWAEPYSLSSPRPGGALEIPIANNSKNLHVAKLESASGRLRTATVFGRTDDWLDEAQRADCDYDRAKAAKSSFGDVDTIRVEIAVRSAADLQKLFEVLKISRRVESALRYEKPSSVTTPKFLIDLTPDQGGLLFSECYYRGFNSLCSVFGQIADQVSGEFSLKKTEQRNWRAQSEVLACVIRRTILITQQAG